MLTFSGDAGTRRDDILRSMALMTRRGPDASGLWTDDAHCIFGFRRLSILDLSAAANQPMRSADGRYVLVYNGELYNFREIRKTLEARGVRFRSTGDAEVVLYALAEFGVEALQRFNGMFALALYDAAERRLLLARDHAGIKPLYVLTDRGGVAFASQYDQILALPWARTRAVNGNALALYLNFGYLPPPFGLLDDSRALEAGSWLSVSAGGGVESGRFFEFPRFRAPDRRGDAAVEAVDAAIAGAVRSQLVSDVPVGVFLSGGIDSPLVAAKAQQASAAPIPAFTLGTNGDACDESADASRYAGALGLRHFVRQISSADVLDLLDDVVSAYSEPHDDYSIFPTLVVSRKAREQVTVVLSGDGGDDLFWGYPRMLEPLSEPESAASGPRRGTVGWYAKGHRFVDAQWLAALFPLLPDLPRTLALFDFDGGSADELAQWMRWSEYSGHLVRVLQKVDRASMHESLEVRVPLLDRDVVEVATRVDWRSCVDPRRQLGKLPLRASLQKHVPFQTLTKRGFEVPMAAWLRGPLRPLFEDLVLPRRDFLGLPVDRMAVARLFQRHLAGQENAHCLLWRLLSLTLWEARHHHPAPRHV